MCFSGYSKLRFIREDPCDSRLNCSADSVLAVLVLIVNNLMVDYYEPSVSPNDRRSCCICWVFLAVLKSL
jgi:hypothetical protein